MVEIQEAPTNLCARNYLSQTFVFGLYGSCAGTLKGLDSRSLLNIQRSRHDPKILWVDDAKIVGDRIAEVRPVPGNYFTQETERCIGELGASCIAFVVRDVPVHETP